MYLITIKGKAETAYEGNIHDLDGIDCEDEFSEWFDRDFSFVNDVSNGYMRFKVIDGELMTMTEYQSTRKLDPLELNQLGEYTQGQWSDGIGEGFEQTPCYYPSGYDEGEDNDEVYISPWYLNQKLIIEQNED